MTANYLIWLIVKPSQLILLAALLSLLCCRWRFGRRLGLVTAGLVVLFGLVPTAAWLMAPLEARFPARAIDGDVAGVIVLAGSERVTVSELHAEPHFTSMGTRLSTFLLLATRYPQARLVHTGNARESRVFVFGALEYLPRAGAPTSQNCISCHDQKPCRRSAGR